MGNCGTKTKKAEVSGPYKVPVIDFPHRLDTHKEHLIKKKRGMCIHTQSLSFLMIRNPKLLRTYNPRVIADRSHQRSFPNAPKKILRPLKALRNCSYESNFKTNVPFSKFITTVKLIPHVKTLTLSIDHENGTQEETNRRIFIISKYIKVLKSLRELNLDFIHEGISKDRMILLLMSNLKACKHLKTIKLSFKGFNNIFSQRLIRTTFETLLHFPALTNLHLNFDTLVEMNSVHFSSICMGIIHLKPLSVLSLSFKSCLRFNDSDLQSLSSSLFKHPSLTKLNLNFDTCDSLTDIGLTALAQSLKKLPRLWSLTLDFSGCSSITEIVIEYTFQKLQALPLLTELDLGFRDRRDSNPEFVLRNDKFIFTDHKFILNLTSGLESLTSLKSLTLDFKQSKNLQTIKPLSQALKKLTNLQSIFLSFGEDTPEEWIPINLFYSFETLTNLKTLHLVLHRNQKFKDAALDSLSDTITFLKQLTSFRLSFEPGDSIDRRKEITNPAILKLSEALEKRSLLRSLALNFSCFQFYDDTLKLISASLAKMELLSEVDLSFAHCSSITGSGIMSISMAIKGLKTLRTVKLNFSSCPLFGTGYIFLVQTLKRMPGLKTVRLNFLNCSNFIRREYAEVQLWKIPDLTVNNSH